ncbi:hypothetical protein ERO13_D13G143750v2 [Gossypium hirsutum]|uniref:Uncharacterized protein n=2 Tax=Gossypium TaxID=3633 RepID=A0A5J5NME4_GOSBA|nr:hypothetical protein ES319_D13G163500v1 [Gossypium barbadense]KAG4112124.1 hypothetical protein ERO13_D13G143750v2 [Gossypium hirsutum]TYI47352.1 hypothetical protein E1A91_D13G167200v1 [Gossypium mustelinum]
MISTYTEGCKILLELGGALIRDLCILILWHQLILEWQGGLISLLSLRIGSVLGLLAVILH